jgi:hypothetical protein
MLPNCPAGAFKLHVHKHALSLPAHLSTKEGVFYKPSNIVFLNYRLELLYKAKNGARHSLQGERSYFEIPVGGLVV